MGNENADFIRNTEHCFKSGIPLPGTEAETRTLDAIAMQFWRDFAAACDAIGIALSASPPDRPRGHACSRIHPESHQVLANLRGFKFTVLVYEPFRQHRDGRLEGIGQLSVALGQRPSSRWKSARPQPLSERARRLVRRIQREVARSEEARAQWQREEPMRRRRELVQKRIALRRQNRAEVRRRIAAAAKRFARFERLVRVREALGPVSTTDARARRWLARVDRYLKSVDPRQDIGRWFAKPKSSEKKDAFTPSFPSLDAPSYPWWRNR